LSGTDFSLCSSNNSNVLISALPYFLTSDLPATRAWATKKSV
jgi:hypothetical protein